MPLAQAQSETAMGAPAVAPVNAATDSSVLRLSNAYADTAERIRVFQENKEYIKKSPSRLNAELKKVVMFLEPLREEMGRSVPAELEALALAELQSDAELARYASDVQKLWKKSAVSTPLAARYICSVIAPDAVRALEEPESEEYDDEASPLPVLIALGTVALLVVLIVLVVLQKRKESELLKEPEPTPLPPAPEPPASPTEPEDTAQKVKDANDYNLSFGSVGNEFVRSTDIEGVEMLLPKRKETGSIYRFLVRYGQVSQTYSLTKRVVSFGRRGDKRSNPDIPLELPESASRMLGVLIYRDDQEGVEPSWLMAVNQHSEHNPGWENVSCAYLHRKGAAQPVADVAFTLKHGDMVEVVVPYFSVTADGTQQKENLSIFLTIEK